jgi:hypothetical protein
MSSTALVINPLGGVQKYFDLAAQAAIAVQQVAKDAPGQTKLGLALNFVNVGLSVAATAAPQIAPLLGLAVGLESPFAGLISSCVQLFKAHNLHGFSSGKPTPQPAPTPIALPVPTAVAAAAAAWDAQTQAGG